MKFLIKIILSGHAFAGIFYNDDRIDFHQIRDDKIKEISRSIPALPTSYLQQLIA